MKEVVIGVDIGGTNTAIGVADRDGSIYASANIKTSEYHRPEDFVKALTSEIDVLIAKEYILLAVGIGAPNGNYNRGTIEQATNLEWKGIIPLAGMIEEILGVKVVLTNDANAAALGEQLYGAAKGMDNFILLTLGTGLGSGIVVNGDVLYGHTGFAGEYGHLNMLEDGRLCGCGRSGCLETYVSATGIVTTVNMLLEETAEESLLRSTENGSITSKIISEAAASGDKLALKAFDFTANMLARAISNAVVVTSPEAVFLFGGLANAGDLLLKPVRKYFDTMVFPILQNTVKILPSGLQEDNAAVLGSSALAWKSL